MILIYDTETTGFVKPLDRPISEQPHLVQLALMLCNDEGDEMESYEAIIKPDGWDIPDRVAEIHGITTARATEEGIPLVEAITEFLRYCDRATEFVAHHIEFDFVVMYAALHRADKAPERGTLMPHAGKPMRCTMKSSTDICKLPKARGAGFKYPKLIESYLHFFGEGFPDAHTAMGDVRATKRVYFALKAAGAFNG